MIKKLLLTLMVVQNMSGLIKIGHRGVCGYEPENTLISFERAIELDVDMIEFDVMQCKTGELVVIHDATVDKTTNGFGLVKDLTLEQLKKLDAGNGQKIPTLQETLDLVDRRCKVNIEIKDFGIAQKVGEVIEDYIKNKNWSYDDFLISSFNFGEIKKFIELFPQVETALIFDEVQANYIDFAKEFGTKIIVMPKKFVNKKLLLNAHENEIKVYVYTVNEPNEIEYFTKIKVDGIFSNYPDKII